MRLPYNSGMPPLPVLPNVITAFSLTCGLFVLFKAAALPASLLDQAVLVQMAGLLLLAAVADFADGAVARLLKAESRFGGFFDSLADAITFGVAPALVVVKSTGPALPFFITAAGMIYIVCGVLRLARYNATYLVGEPPQDKNFIGLPIPAAAAAISSVNLLLASEEGAALFALSAHKKSWVLALAMLLIGYFMVSRWRFFSFKALHIRVRSFRVVFCTVLVAVALFYGVLHHFPLVFFLMAWAYVLVAWLLSIVRVVAGRRAKVLEDFEPPHDHDD